MPISRWFSEWSLGRHLCCLLLGMCVFVFPISYAEAHGGGSGSSGSGSSSGSSGSGSSSASSGGSGGHGGSSSSMGSSSASSFGGFTGNGSVGGGTGHGGTSHGSGHGSVSTSTHGTAVTHNASMTVSKNSVARNQSLRNGFTSDTMLVRSPGRTRNREIFSRTTSTGGYTPETDRRKKLKTNSALAAKNGTQSSATR
jgi:hypothetical protein